MLGGVRPTDDPSRQLIFGFHVASLSVRHPGFPADIVPAIKLRTTRGAHARFAERVLLARSVHTHTLRDTPVPREQLFHYTTTRKSGSDKVSRVRSSPPFRPFDKRVAADPLVLSHLPLVGGLVRPGPLYFFQTFSPPITTRRAYCVRRSLFTIS